MANSDPENHRRRSIRLRGYDYSQAGAFFVTICSWNKQCLFGDVVDSDMRLNVIGRIAEEQWQAIPQRFPDVELDAFVVMPNHIHGIVVIVGARDRTAENRATARVAPTGSIRNHDSDNETPAVGATLAVARSGTPTVGNIVGAYKSLCVHQALTWIRHDSPGQILGKLWQRNYWEHVIRNEAELSGIREYICNNPLQWELDALNPAQDR